MGKTYETITPELAGWIAQQHLFFVATAPLAAGGSINVSPKGLDSLRIVGPRQVAYLDLTGSGAETIAHVRENGRIVLMFCAFADPPKIVRLHGRADLLEGVRVRRSRDRPTAVLDQVAHRAPDPRQHGGIARGVVHRLAGVAARLPG